MASASCYAGGGAGVSYRAAMKWRGISGKPGKSIEIWQQQHLASGISKQHGVSATSGVGSESDINGVM